MKMVSWLSSLVWFLSALSVSWSQTGFDCPPLPPLMRPARTVHELRPQDIKVVMALGDSVTAGFGMMGAHGVDVPEDLSEYRGWSWSIGMEDGAITVPNFLRHYNPSLVGGSLGHHLVELCYGVICPPYQYRPKEDVFNAAQSGAMVFDLVSPELKYLKEQLKEHKIDMQNDWKLLTLFIGANDLCLGCSGDVPGLNVDDYEKHLREVLKEVEASIPKVFVNLVLMGNISEIYKLSLKTEYCTDVHRIFPIECVCAFSPGKIGDATRLDMDRMVAAINGRMRKIAADYAKKKSDHFAVVLQPFVSRSHADDFPIGYLSSLDCFHPSLVAHQSMAVALWNNMITPAAEKKTTFKVGEAIKCPTNETLLYTY